jgi:hypothetical protein
VVTCCDAAAALGFQGIKEFQRHVCVQHLKCDIAERDMPAIFHEINKLLQGCTVCRLSVHTATALLRQINTKKIVYHHE